MTRASGLLLKQVSDFSLTGTRIDFHPSVAIIERPKMILNIFLSQTVATLDVIAWSRRSKLKIFQSERERQ
jgi:hypothetical protein